MKVRRTTIAVNIIALLFIMLFTYTASSKLIAPNAFIGALKASPLLARHAIAVAYGIIGAEILCVACLVYQPLRLLGFYMAFSLMVLFTLYIAYMLATASALPCSCGGIFRKLSWKAHLLVNSLLTVLAAVALWVQLQSTHKQPVLSA